MEAIALQRSAAEWQPRLIFSGQSGEYEVFQPLGTRTTKDEAVKIAKLALEATPDAIGWSIALLRDR